MDRARALILSALLALTLAGQEAAARPQDAMPGDDPCVRSFVRPDGVIRVRKPDCIVFLPQREFEGLWIRHFEGSVFLEGGVFAALSASRSRDDIWFDAEAARFPKAFPPLLQGHVFRVRFRGRAAAYAHPRSLAGYGHMNAFGRLIVADEIMVIEDLGPAPVGR